MITVIGSKSCSRCEITKNVLNSKGIDFEYKLYDEASEEEKARIKELNLKQLPIVFDGEKNLTLQEVAQL